MGVPVRGQGGHHYCVLTSFNSYFRMYIFTLLLCKCDAKLSLDDGGLSFFIKMNVGIWKQDGSEVYEVVGFG